RAPGGIRDDIAAPFVHFPACKQIEVWHPCSFLVCLDDLSSTCWRLLLLSRHELRMPRANVDLHHFSQFMKFELGGLFRHFNFSDLLAIALVRPDSSLRN